jgi:hypothetical protein
MSAAAVRQGVSVFDNACEPCVAFGAYVAPWISSSNRHEAAGLALLTTLTANLQPDTQHICMMNSTCWSVDIAANKVICRAYAMQHSC